MNSLKSKFGKFAVSAETSRNVRGGDAPEYDPWDDDGGGYPGGNNWTCWNSSGRQFHYNSSGEAITAFLGALGALDGCSNGN